MGLDEQVSKRLGVPLSAIFQSFSQQPGQPPMRITHIFDADKFMQVCRRLQPATLPPPPEHSQATYRAVWLSLQSAAIELGIEWRHEAQPPASFLNRAHILIQEEPVDEATWGWLRVMCDMLFQVVLKNENVLLVITRMQEHQQIEIKEYIEGQQALPDSHHEIQSPNEPKSSSKNSIGGRAHEQLIQRFQQLEHAYASKEQQLAKTKEKLNEAREELASARNQLQERVAEVHQLKMRISAYSEAELLFEEKDEEISKLNTELTDIKIRHHVKQTELNAEVAKLRQALKQLEAERTDLAASNEQLLGKFEALSVAKEEADLTNKKVISNLKEKIRVLNEKIAQQQRSILDVLSEKELKQKQLYELEKRNAGSELKSRPKISSRNEEVVASARKSSKLVDEIGDLNQADFNISFKVYFEALFGDSDQKCAKQLCIALRSEYVRVVQHILNITNDTESLGYMTPENRSSCIQSQLEKISEILQENMKLKERIVLLQSEGKGQASKESIEQINKLKKKLLVMKRNLEEVESKRKQQLEILVSVVSQNFTFDTKS